MKRFLALLIVITVSILLPGCRVSGSSAPAPTNVAVVAGDTIATVSWDMLPGVEYWVFKAAGTDITPRGCYGMPQCQMLMKATSPTVVSGLTNGTVYAFTVNGRRDGGPGGPGSPAVQATPRLAGATWSTGAALGTGNLQGATYGTVYVAAGTSGALFSSADGIAWTALTNPLPAANFNAASYYGGNYLVAGAGGAILRSPDAVTWTAQTSGTTNDLYAVSNYGTAGFVATGATGTILTSIDGITWSVIPPITANTLFGITYGNSKYVAVGAAGTLLTSTDGRTWNSQISNTSNMLKGVAYAPVIGTTGTGTFVAVGANGMVVTSIDGGATWTPATLPFAPTAVINSVTYGRQFIAVDNTGNIFTSIDGLAWTLAQTTTSPLYAVTHGLYDYAAVGASGLNIHAM